MPEKDFDELFEEAANEDGTSKKEATEEEKAEAKKLADAKAAEEADSKNKEGEEDSKYEELEHKYKTLQGMIEHEQKEKSEIAKGKKELEDRLAAIDVARTGNSPKPSEEEEGKDEELEKYLADYAYISSNESKLRKRELDKLKKDIVAEISKVYEVPIKTVERLVEEDAEVKLAVHVGAIKEAHEDYGTTIQKEDIVKWAETLTPTRKKASLAVIKEGDTDEVIDLIREYKEANNISTEKPNDSSEDKMKTKKTDKLESLEVVKGKKGPVTGGGKGKAESYDDAFNEAASVK